MTIHYQGHGVTLHHGDCLDVLRTLPDASVDSVVTDPPYGLEFMGKEWDSFAPQNTTAQRSNAGGFGAEEGKPWNKARSGTKGVRSTFRCRTCQGWSGAFSEARAKRQKACECETPDYDYAGAPAQTVAFGKWCELWAQECLRVLKPGGHLLAFGGTRTWHRLACAVEDAGFEVRDSIAWLYGSGFPKSLRVSRDERFCHCDASVHTSSRTSPERSPDDHTRTERDEAAAEGGGRSAPRATSAPLGSPAGYRPEPGSGDALPRRAGVTDLASAQPREGARARSHSAELAGDPVAGSLRSPFLARRTAHPSSLDSASPSRSLTGEPTHTQASTSPAGTSESASDTRGTAQDPSYLYGTGFPLCSTCDKPMVDGLGTAMKPSFEPVVVARKPLSGTVAANVLAHGTGALNIDGCRVGDGGNLQRPERRGKGDTGGWADYEQAPGQYGTPDGQGRWPANVVLDEEMARRLDEQSGEQRDGTAVKRNRSEDGRAPYDASSYMITDRSREDHGYGGQGGASRFFPTFRYEAKAPTSERPRYKREGGSDNATTYGQMKKRECNVCGNRTCPAGGDQSGKPWPTCGHNDWSWVEQQSARDEFVSHPTVKPLDLMRWLVRLVTPPGGTVLEPFAGSGTTVEACIIEGFDCIAIEKGIEYLPLIMQRIHRRRDPVAAIRQTGDELGLFELDGEGA